MNSKYNLDPSQMSLVTFRQSIQSRKLVPSRRILNIGLEKTFDKLDSMGLRTLKDLLDALKSKAKLESFAKESGFDTSYLTLLKREANSYFPKPVKLSAFKGVEEGNIAKLASMGIINTKHLFDRVRTEADKTELCNETGLSSENVLELVSLSDLSRLYGVGPVFARLLCDLGIDSVKAFVRLKPREVIALYEKENQKKADFTESDIKFTLELAVVLDNT